MMDGIVRFGLIAKGMSEEEIEAIDRLLVLEKQLEPILQRELPTLTKIITQAWPDIIIAMPAIIKLVKGT